MRLYQSQSKNLRLGMVITQWQAGIGFNSQSTAQIKETMIIMSSQQYINNGIVAGKIENKDFDVTLAQLTFNNVVFAVVVDGHHSLVAANETGVEPVFIDSDYNYQNDLEYLGLDGFLEAHYNDSDWCDINTGHGVDWDVFN